MRPRPLDDGTRRQRWMRLTVVTCCAALMASVLLGQPCSGWAQGGSTIAKSPRASSSMPSLLRPFYLTNEGTMIDGAEESALVDTAQWATEATDDLTTHWAPALLRPFSITRDTRPARAIPTHQHIAFHPDAEPLPEPEPSDIGDADGSVPSPSGVNVLAGGSSSTEQTIGRAPEDTSLQFLRTETPLLKPGQVQWDVGLNYTILQDQLPIFVNPTIVARARIRQRQLVLPLRFRYGLTQRIQLSLAIPFGWANTELALAGFDEFGNSGGLGDIRLGATVLLRQGSKDCADIIGNFSVTAPTGNDSFLLQGLLLPSPDLGNGFWKFGGDVLFVNNYDPVVVFYGVGAQFGLEADYFGRIVQPGTEFRYQFGLGFAVNERVTLSTTVFGAYITEFKVDGDRFQGSILEPITMRFAATLAKKKKLIEPFAEIGVTNDAASGRVGITWTY